MRQTRIQRKPRRSGRPGDGPADLLPTGAASDTAAAGELLARIDALVGD